MLIVELDPTEWHHHPDGDDVAVAIIKEPEDGEDTAAIPEDKFLTRQIVEREGIGPGDEVFFLGRFISHDGRQRNLPSARFGNVSMMPWEPVDHPRGVRQESFLVEARSIAGYSGSPVFVYQEAIVLDDGEISGLVSSDFYLLGVAWGHLTEPAPVYSDDQSLSPDGWRVAQNTGMMTVVPAWKITELLNSIDGH